MQWLGQAGVKFTVQPADKIGRIHIQRLVGQFLFQELLDGDVRQAEMLVITLSLIAGEVALHRPLDIAGYCFVAFNQVGIIAVHFADHVRDALEHLR